MLLWCVLLTMGNHQHIHKMIFLSWHISVSLLGWPAQNGCVFLKWKYQVWHHMRRLLPILARQLAKTPTTRIILDQLFILKIELQYFRYLLTTAARMFSVRSRGASLRPLTQLQNQKMLQVKKISFDNPALYIEKQKNIYPIFRNLLFALRLVVARK